MWLIHFFHVFFSLPIHFFLLNQNKKTRKILLECTMHVNVWTVLHTHAPESLMWGKWTLGSIKGSWIKKKKKAMVTHVISERKRTNTKNKSSSASLFISSHMLCVRLDRHAYQRSIGHFVWGKHTHTHSSSIHTVPRDKNDNSKTH